MQRGGTVYLLTNVLKTVLYTGVISNIIVRMYKHKNRLHPSGFTTRYNVIYLVYYANFPTIQEAIAEEKRIKAGNRRRKYDLINSINLEWKDLWDEEVSKL
jgi:putative endonuclease